MRTIGKIEPKKKPAPVVPVPEKSVEEPVAEPSFKKHKKKSE